MKFLNNAYVKTIFPAVLSLFLGICGSIVASGIYTGDIFTNKVCIIFIILGIISLVISIIIGVYYLKQEKKQADRIRDLENEIKENLAENKLLDKKYNAMLDAFISFGHEFDISSDKIYSIIDRARQTKSIRLEAWNKQLEYDFICESLYALIRDLAETGDNFSVSVITKEPINSKNKKTFNYLMLSRSGKTKSKPRIYRTPITIREASKYYYGKLFAKNNPEPSYLLTKDELRKNFYFRNGEDKNKYSQYIGIPICCSGHDMSGLIQIIAHEDSLISSDEDKIKDILNKEVFVYANYALLCEKIEKIFLL